MLAPLPSQITESSPLFKARMAGFFWLMTIITGMFAFIAGGRLFVAGDAATTAVNVMAHVSLYRLAFVSNLIATVCYLAVTLFVYLLLKPVNRRVALFGVFVSLIGCTVAPTGSLLFIAPLDILGSNQSLSGFTTAQLQAQALTFLTLSMQVNDIGLVFFGCHVLSIGYLIRRSTFLPHWLGILLFIAGICYLTNSFASFLDLPFKTYLPPFIAIGGLLGEGSLTAWLLVKGVNVERWKELAAAAAK